MQQSNVIFGMLFVAFIVFITVRGELPEYISLLRGSGKATTGAGTATSSNNVTAGAQSMLGSGEQLFGITGDSSGSGTMNASDAASVISMFDY